MNALYLFPSAVVHGWAGENAWLTSHKTMAIVVQGTVLDEAQGPRLLCKELSWMSGQNWLTA